MSDVADYILNKKRRDIVALQGEGQMSVQIRGVHGAPPELCDFVCLDRNDNEERLGPPPEPMSYRARRWAEVNEADRDESRVPFCMKERFMATAPTIEERLEAVEAAVRQ